MVLSRSQRAAGFFAANDRPRVAAIRIGSRRFIKATFADGKEIEIRNDKDNGFFLEGTEVRNFVNRGRLSGVAVDELATKPLHEIRSNP